MSKIAVIKTGGKQYKIREGEELRIEKIAGDAGDKIKFEVLLMADEEGNDVQIGKPFLASKIDAEIIEQGRAKKILVIKYKPKVRYAKKKGHRQMFTKVKIGKV
jgi:large subunit ribosomal protein L21